LGLGLILLGVVLALNVLIASVRRWRERAEGQTGAWGATSLGASL
jgi:tungstate transport system permease protein